MGSPGRTEKEFQNIPGCTQEGIDGDCWRSLQPGKSSVHAADSIVMKAVNMWLEFGMQRCRILVVMQGPKLRSIGEKIRTAHGETLELIVRPELKRFGNSKGQDVHIEETVEDCVGEIAKVSMSR